MRNKKDAGKFKEDISANLPGTESSLPGGRKGGQRKKESGTSSDC